MKRVIDFMKARVFFLVLSAIVMVAGIAGTVVQGGFNLGIDFQAGLSLTVDIDARTDVDVERVRTILAEIDGIQIQRLGDPADDTFVVRVRDDGTIADFQTSMASDIMDTLAAEIDGAQVTELEVAYVGPRFSQDLTQQAIFLTLFALALVLGYLWFRFRLAYALASVAALVHDVVVILGVIGTLQLEVTTATIAAVLTIIGYSLNDTIVIFDRVRENEELLRESSMKSIINTSITQSLARTLITSITTLLAVAAIVVFSNGAIQLFALKLMIGVVVGTYSSVFIASPALAALQAAIARRRRARENAKFGGGRAAVPATGEEGASKESAPATGAHIEAARREVARQQERKRSRKSR